jgi:hypothetical protein
MLLCGNLEQKALGLMPILDHGAVNFRRLLIAGKKVNGK